MSFKRWFPTFLAFPLGGLIAIETIGSVDGPLFAAAGGLIAGTIIGAGQWLALRSRGTSPRWIGATAGAMAMGGALAAAITGAGTALADVVVVGAITGAAVGAAQATLLARPSFGRAAVWTGATAVAWALGWAATSATIVDVERGYAVFGASGAVAATLLTGFALRHLLGATRPRPAAPAARAVAAATR
jgi:hypothetical protein